MYHISETDVFDWSKVMCDCNELFIEKGKCNSLLGVSARVNWSTKQRNERRCDYNSWQEQSCYWYWKTGDLYGEDKFLDVTDFSEKKTTIVYSLQRPILWKKLSIRTMEIKDIQNLCMIL